jgi:hypothetical protein
MGEGMTMGTFEWLVLVGFVSVTAQLMMLGKQLDEVNTNLRGIAFLLKGGKSD